MTQNLQDVERVLAGEEIARELDAPDASIAQLQAALSCTETREVKERFYHEGIGGWLSVVQMDLRGYYATAPDVYTGKMPDGRPIPPQMLANIGEINYLNKAKVYLQHGVLLQSQAMSAEQAYSVAKHQSWGASNLALIQCIDKWNPRYGNRLDLFTIILSRQNALAIAIDYFVEYQMLPDLAKKLGETDDTVVAMMKLRDFVRATCKVRETAKNLGLDFEEALKKSAKEIQARNVVQISS